MFTNAPELCLTTFSVPIGCSDHNMIAVVRKAKIPKTGPKIIVKRSYKLFKTDCFKEEVKNLSRGGHSKGM